MRTASFESSSKRSRSFDTAECSREPPRFDVGGPMLPVYLNDLSRNIRGGGGGGGEEMVEVTLELDDNSVVLCSVAPAANAASDDDDDQPRSNGFLPRSTSAASRLRRLFSWRRTPSARTSTSDTEEQHHQLAAAAVVPAREIMKMKAKMMRTKSSAQRALGGLRFISRSTGGGQSNPDMLWKLVESRFDILAVDGLLSRHEFGECIGIIATSTVIDYHLFSMC